MGWGIGIGIGWPNSTSGNSGVYEFEILDCNGTPKQVWSTSSQFLPGAYMYKNSGLSNPFANEGYWNLAGLIYSIGGYEMSLLGQVKSPLLTCPA